jgi:hypothetical protein
VVSSFSVSLSYALQPVSRDTYTFSLNLCDCYRNAFRHHLKNALFSTSWDFASYTIRMSKTYVIHTCHHCLQSVNLQGYKYMNTVYVLYYDRDCLTYTDEIFYPMLKHVSHFQQTVDSSFRNVLDKPLGTPTRYWDFVWLYHKRNKVSLYGLAIV